jgi:hypothetical protein
MIAGINRLGAFTTMTLEGQIMIPTEVGVAPRLAAYRAFTFEQKAVSCAPAMEFSA